MAWFKHTYNETIVGITSEEQAYINSVAQRMNQHPELKAKLGDVLGELREAFSRSKDNDTLSDALAHKLQQAGISTGSWER